MEFDWDDATTEHIARHGIEPGEAEEALSDPDAAKGEAHRRDSQEPRAAVIGQTDSGRLLFVVFTVRGGRIRVVTARDATAREKRRYS